MPQDVLPGRRKCLNNSGNVAVNLQLSDRTLVGLWLSSGKLRIAGDFPDAPHWLQAVAVNEQDTVIGTASANYPPIRNSVSSIDGFVWTKNAGPSKIPRGNRQEVCPVSTNEAGITIGSEADGTQHFIFYPDAHLEELSWLDGKPGFLVAINKNGWILCSRGDPIRPVIWKRVDATVMDLGAPPGFLCGFGIDLNDRGEVLVDGEAIPALGRPFLWTEQSGYSPVQFPENASVVVPIAINNHSDMLLMAWHPGPEGNSLDYFISGNDRIRSLPPAPDGRPATYTAINDRGQVTGFSATREGHQQLDRRGFVATPIW